MPTILDIQHLVQLTCNFPVTSPTGGNGCADIPIGGNGLGRARSVAGSGSHWFTTDGVEHAAGAISHRLQADLETQWQGK